MKPKILQYWLGAPSKYNPNRKDLEGFPEVDAGGRELGLPEDITPAMFFDDTMPKVMQLQREARKRAVGNALDPIVILTQGIQVVWIFASAQVTRMQTMLAGARADTANLERRVSQLESLLSEKH